MTTSPDKTTAPHPAVQALDALWAQADERVQMHRRVYAALSDKGEHGAAALALSAHDEAVHARGRVAAMQKGLNA